MSKKGVIIWLSILMVLLVLTIPYAVYIIKTIFLSGDLLSQLEIFKWVSVGFLLFLLIKTKIKGNLRFLETFSHELTHTVFAFIFNKRVVEFHANQGSGYILSGHRNEFIGVPIALSPYCIPLFTLILLSFRWMMDFHGVWIFDILIGATICFHFFCFKNQIGNYQTDINQYPKVLAYGYIFTSWLLIFCIVIPSFFPNMNGHGTAEPMYNYGVFSSFWRLLENWWSNLKIYFEILF